MTLSWSISSSWWRDMTSYIMTRQDKRRGHDDDRMVHNTRHDNDDDTTRHSHHYNMTLHRHDHYDDMTGDITLTWSGHGWQDVIEMRVAVSRHLWEPPHSLRQSHDHQHSYYVATITHNNHNHKHTNNHNHTTITPLLCRYHTGTARCRPRSWKDCDHLPINCLDIYDAISSITATASLTWYPLRR